jgi:FlaA1/EpsC-like NDP-sugar epimerase
MIDTLVTFIAIGLTGVFWRSFGPLDVGWPKAVVLAIGFSLLYSVSNAFLGVNRISWSQASFTDAMDMGPALGAASLAAVLMNSFLFTRQPFPVGMVLMAAVLASAGFVVVRYRSRLVSSLALRWLSRSSATLTKERVIIVGGGESGQFAAWLLQNGKAASAYHIVGYVDDDLYKQGIRIRGVNVVGSREDLPELVRRYDVGVIIFAIHNIPTREKQSLMRICSSTAARVVTFPDLVSSLHQALKDNARDAAGSVYAAAQNAHNSGAEPRLLESEHLDAWLGELGELAESGDLDAIRTRIQDLRSQVGSGTNSPRTA